MPLTENSSYQPPWWLKNAHLSTIIPSLFRKVEGIAYDRERIDTPDEDFIDLDWLDNGSNSLLLLAHGLEGSSERGYMKGLAKYFSDRSWDVVAYNCRSCSGEMNRAPRLYHHGDTADLDTVITHINSTKTYICIALVGFSMGGSIILNYLGNGKHEMPRNIKVAATFSVPCDLKDSALTLSKNGRGFYRKRFLKKLIDKLKIKVEQFPNLIDLDGVEEVDSFPKFEQRFTAPLHGFESGDDFYRQASCVNYLKDIQVPSLIVNAENDPFFSEACYPKDIVDDLDKVYLEIPKYGGHVGFALSRLDDNWMEKRAWEFIESHSSASS